MELTVSIVGYVLAAVFILAGVAKLAQVKMMKDNFAKYGFPDWFLRVVGLGEVTGGVLLLIPGLAIFGATGLAVIMVGAIITHVMSKEAPMAAPPLVLLVLSLFLVVERSSDFAQMVIGA
ncbi:MAG: DoxX family protein [Proteobacteria bacterium]|nr:DoxX family protein [Pseudomonadota bacterium]MDA1059834.1 DoxX family protein [Pseudomonadota bacterium]